MRTIIGVIASGLLPVLLAAPASGAETLTPRAELVARLNGLQSFHAHFEQRIEGARGELIEQSTGELLLKRPNLRWQVDAPYPQIIVANGEELSIYDPDLAQVIVRPMGDALGETPVALLTRSNVTLSNDYDVTLLEPDAAPDAAPDAREEGATEDGAVRADAAATVVYRLTPTSPQSLFQELRLYFDADGLTRLSIYDQLGQYTSVRFKQITDDRVIDSKAFDLDLPADVDIVEG